jgi:hypothetical protein
MALWGRRKLSARAERDAFRKAWLDQRMRHDWQPTEKGSLCARCGQRYTPARDVKRCPARRRPNRWGVHERRAWMRRQYPTGKRPVLDLLREATWEAEAVPETLWPDHPKVRRYRRLLRKVWTLPVREVRQYIGTSEGPNTYESRITRKLKALLREADKRQTLVLTDGPCTYTLRPEALHRVGGFIR